MHMYFNLPAICIVPVVVTLFSDNVLCMRTLLICSREVTNEGVKRWKGEGCGRSYFYFTWGDCVLDWPLG